MATVKCPKCGEEYDGLYGHTCRVEEKEKRREAEKKWRRSSGIGKFFQYHPDTPFALRAVAFLLLLAAAGGLFVFLTGLAGVAGDIAEERSSRGLSLLLIIYGLISFISALVFSYGIAHLKRWAFYLYGVWILFSIILGVWQREFGLAIIIPIVIGILLWSYRKKFK